MLLSLVLGGLAATLRIQDGLQAKAPSDFGQVWFAARALLEGRDPYLLIGPHATFDWPWPFVYPLSAAPFALPFAYLSEPAASAAFVAVGGALFAWVLMEYGYGPLFGFFSWPVREAAGAAQWSLALAATVGIPALSLLVVAKPTAGAAIFAARPRWSGALAGLAVVAIVSIAQPAWPVGWYHAMQRYRDLVAPAEPFRPMISFPGGVVALLCTLRWRRPEARLVAALAVVPITVSAYELVPLLLVPRSFWQAALLVALGHLQQHLTLTFLPRPWTFEQFVEVKGTLLVLSLYVPSTLMVLRRPNEGPVPKWVEQRVASWPSWLRGGC